MLSRRIILVIIDACGVGELPDAGDYGDTGAATLRNVAAAVGGLNMPHCRRLGLGNITAIEGVAPAPQPTGCIGKMAEKAAGKDSTSGHWELAGVTLSTPLPLFPDGFPRKLVERFELRAGVKTIGNVAASGTEIIHRLGERHLQTGEVILYTSADSVFQLAAHENLYPIEKQYEFCRIAREMLRGEYGVGRVIARPFVGSPGRFTRTAGRRDFSLAPPSETILDLLTESGRKTLAIGKVYDLYAGRGIASHIKTSCNKEVIEGLEKTMRNDSEHDLVFANLCDFDQLWGHRNDVKGFATGLEEFDRGLGLLLPLLKDDDLLIITADHGCDPTITSSTDHTREYVPLLVYAKGIAGGVPLGTRETFADVACTIAEVFGIKHNFDGSSFYSALNKENV